MKIKYRFKDENLFNLAMTQSGIDGIRNNEKLEFVGDRVLGLSVAALLYTMFPDETEGELARRYAVLVSTDTLYSIAGKLELDKSLRHGHVTGGHKKRMLANALEAVFGAMFVDAGFETVREYICSIWRDLAAAEAEAPKDSKTKLQEFVQKHANGALPVYEYTETIGPDRCPLFQATVTAMGDNASGEGPSKKSAGIAAAAALYRKIALPILAEQNQAIKKAAAKKAAKIKETATEEPAPDEPVPEKKVRKKVADKKTEEKTVIEKKVTKKIKE